LIGVTWLTYALVAAGLAIIYLFPLLTKASLAAGHASSS
jgi:SulP family sulfate permease